MAGPRRAHAWAPGRPQAEAVGSRLSRSALSDEALLRALARGRMRALAELLTRHGPHVQAQARRMGLHDPPGAVQEVFVRLARDAACARRSPLDARAWLLLHAGLTLQALAAAPAVLDPARQVA